MRAWGKTGPLYEFGAVEESFRVIQDSTQTREDSHAGKVCIRQWYERNKHIFPANRWEPFDAEKSKERKTTMSKVNETRIVVM